MEGSFQKITLTVTERFRGIEECMMEITLQFTFRKLKGRRSVDRALWGSTPIVVKRYFPHPKQSRDRQREWERLKKLYSLGLDVPEPLCWGVDNTGAEVVVLRYLENGRNLEDYLFADCSQQERQVIFQQLMEVLATHHRAGLWQGDSHLGNFIWDGEKLYALDAASFKFVSGSLNLALRAKNLAQLLVAGKWSWTEEMWEALPFYTEKMGRSEWIEPLKKKLGQWIPYLRKKRLKGYLKKTRRSCSDFERQRSRGKCLLTERILPAALKQQFAENPDRLIQDGEVIKAGNTCTVAAFEMGGQAYILKRYNLKPLFYRICHIFHTSRALKSWSSGHGWRLIGLPTPRPWACLEERRWPLRGRSFLLLEKDFGTPLEAFVSEHWNQPDLLSMVTATFAQVWRAWGQLKAFHGDLKASNILVSEEGSLSFLDLDSFRFFLSSFCFRRKRKKDYCRFIRNWQENPEVAALFHERIGRDG